MKKKASMLMLICLLVLSVIPTHAFAETTYVAEVNGTKYTSLKDAVVAAEDNDTVTVLESHTIQCNSSDDTEIFDGQYDALIPVVGKKITVDLNGKHVVCDLNADFNGSNGLLGFFAVEDNGDLTLMDSSEEQTGTLEICSEKEDGTGHHLVYSLLLCYDGTSYLTVKSGNYIQDAGLDGAGMVYSSSNERVSVEGGNFTLGNVGTLTNGSPWIFNAKKNNEQHIFVSGGTFNDDINHQYWAFEVEMDPSLALKNNGDGTWTVVPAVAYVNEQEKSGNWYTHEVGYATLEEAIAAANPDSIATNNSNLNPEEIFVIKSIDITEELTIPEGIVINLDTEGADLNVYGTLINNGTIDSTAEGKGKVHIVTNVTNAGNGTETTSGQYQGTAPSTNVGEVEYIFTTDNENYYKDNTEGSGIVVAMKDDDSASMHTSIQDAYAASETNGILLLDNIEESGITIEKDFTLDLGGKTYTVSDSNISVGEGCNVVIKNGTLHGDIQVAAGGKLEVAEGTFSADVSGYCAQGYHARQNLLGMYVVEPHELEETEAVAATCTEDGNIAYWYCDACEKFFSDADAANEISEEDLITPATGHKYVDGKCKCGAEEPKDEPKPENPKDEPKPENPKEEPKDEPKPENPKEEPKDEQKTEEPTGEQDDSKNDAEEITLEESAPGKPDADAEKNFEIDEVAGVYVQGSGEPFYLRGNGEFADFKNVKVDGELVDEQYYSVAEGSTIITFTAEYLDSLEPGKHCAEMIWTTGTAEIEFIIAAAPEKITEEDKKIDNESESKGIDTGDMSSLYLWLMTTFVAIGTLMFTYCVWRKKALK